MRKGEEQTVERLRERDRRIVAAILEKEKQTCPGALALIGVYGSALSGDVHAHSDLDLLLLIRDERGRRLAAAFVQDDLAVGHDLYCTGWDSLERDARCEDPHMSKLMDSRIVWCADPAELERLEALRRRARTILDAPFGEADLHRAETELKRARECFAAAMLRTDLAGMRLHAGCALYCIENAVALLNKRYFRLGVRRRYEELASMERRPPTLIALLEGVAAAETETALRESLVRLLREIEDTFRKACESVAAPRTAPAAEQLRGTWEEMVSNWRGKLRLAAETGDRHLAMMSLVSFDGMMRQIYGDRLPAEPLAAYDPQDLARTAESFEAALTAHLKAYAAAGIAPRHYPDIDSFLDDYLGDSFAAAEKGGKT